MKILLFNSTKKIGFFAISFAAFFFQSCSKPHGTKVENLHYLLDEENMTAEVTYQQFPDNYPEIAGEVTIPSSVTVKDKTYKVIAIGDSAFLNVSGLTSVMLPETIIRLGDSAFEGTGLTSIDNLITIPNLGYDVWSNTAIKEVKLPDNITEIRDNMLAGSQIEEIIIPEGVRKINSGAFCWCNNLRKVVLPSTLEEIGVMAFSNCENLKKIELPNTLTKIDQHAFYGCGFKEVKLPSSVDELGEGAFQNCRDLETFYMSPNVEQLPPDLFEGCDNMTHLVFYNHELPKLPGFANVQTKTHNGIFGQWRNPSSNRSSSENEADLKNFNKFNNVIFSIPYDANITEDWKQDITGYGNVRSDCTPKIRTSYNDPGMPGYYPDYVTNDYLAYALDNENLTATVVLRHDRPAWNTDSLVKYGYPMHGVIIPETIMANDTVYTVTEIGKYAFSNYPMRFSVTLPSTIKKIDEFAFAHTLLWRIALNEGLEEIGVSAFENTELSRVILPTTLKRVLNHAFSKNHNLEKIILFDKFRNGVYFAPSYITNSPYCKGYNVISMDEFYGD